MGELMTLAQAQGEIAPVLHGMDILEQGVGQILSLLPSLDDAALVQVAEYSNRMEQYAWVLRGSVVKEIRNRLAVRQNGGAGKKDLEGVGIKAQLAKMAGELGVSVRTLETDAQIIDTFDVESSAIGNTPLLPRSYYAEALNAPDPVAAVKQAEQKVAQGNYSTAAFRTEIQQAKRKDATATEQPPSQVAVSEKYLTSSVDAELYDVLVNMANEQHLNLRFMLEKAILTLQSVEQGNLPQTAPAAASPYAIEFTSEQHSLLTSAWVNSGQGGMNLADFIASLFDPLAGMLHEQAPAAKKKVKGLSVDDLLNTPAFIELALSDAKRDDVVGEWSDEASRDTIREAWRKAKNGEV